jgi:hypothetical protein
LGPEVGHNSLPIETGGQGWVLVSCTIHVVGWGKFTASRNSNNRSRLKRREESAGKRVNTRQIRVVVTRENEINRIRYMCCMHAVLYRAGGMKKEKSA